MILLYLYIMWSLCVHVLIKIHLLIEGYTIYFSQYFLQNSTLKTWHFIHSIVQCALSVNLRKQDIIVMHEQ